jgi:hypothetical protein
VTDSSKFSIEQLELMLRWDGSPESCRLNRIMIDSPEATHLWREHKDHMLALNYRNQHECCVHVDTTSYESPYKARIEAILKDQIWNTCADCHAMVITYRS